MMRHILLTILALAFSFAPACTLAAGNAKPAQAMRLVNVAYLPATVEQNCLLIDKHGMLWLGTNSGVKSYDGYRFVTYRSDAMSPGLLPNNSVLSLAEDKGDRLWIGTRNGLVCMDRKSGKFTTYHMKKPSQREIYTLFVSNDGTLWIGTDGGVVCCNPDKRTFTYLDADNTVVIDSDGKRQRLWSFSAKSFAEAPNGDIYIGSWSNKIYRYDRKKRLMHSFSIGGGSEMEATYQLMFDPRGRLWVSTWGGGVKCLTRPGTPNDPGLVDLYKGNKAHSTSYKLIYDPVANTVWSCSRNGVGIIDANNLDKGFVLYDKIADGSGAKLTNAVDLATDGSGNIWVLTLNNGLFRIDTRPSPFTVLPVLDGKLSDRRIHSMYTSDGNRFWLSTSPFGVVLYDRTSQRTVENETTQALASLPYNIAHTHVSCITERRPGELWLASNGHGIISISHGKAELKNHSNCQYVKDDYVKALCRLRNGTMAIGERHHLTFLSPAGESRTLDTDLDVCEIYEDRSGNVWVATENKGILRLSGNLMRPKETQCRYYNPQNGKFPVSDAIQCMEDSHGDVWAISNSGGLFLLDRNGDRFDNFSNSLHWGLDRVFSIQEDKARRLWITTENALVCLSQEPNGQIGYSTYTSENGLGDIVFLPMSSLRAGNELLFGSGGNIIGINTEATGKARQAARSGVVVTDLIIDGHRYAELDSAERVRLGRYTPQYLREITIPAAVNKFSVEFALLAYTNTQQCKYAYFLEGYDQEWHYVDATVRQASFENMPSGRYKLHIKAADSDGRWTEMPYPLSIRVLPPWYASTLAYIAYLLLAVACVFFAAMWYQRHLRTKNRLQMAVVFTNIAHELLTPLTVISVSADSIGRENPAAGGHVALIHNNINRLTHMLRQILEVRKAQAGKLKLKVSEAQLGEFCQETVQNLTPLFNPRGLKLTLSIDCMGTKAWFDSDKLEKIIYNMLSNAAKYSRENGTVRFSIRVNDNTATLQVADNGIGISRDKQRHLYDRFLDGDYRRMNVGGTGIGLSLVRDLTRLHHGRIKCESTEGVGTTFTVTFPTDRDSYSADEIDDAPTSAMPCSEMDLLGGKNGLYPNNATTLQEHSKVSSDKETNTDDDREKEYSVLLVEDNVELLRLMENLLAPHYKVKTATNGEKAQRIIQKTALDVVVTDVMMPVMDGIELTQWIKGSAEYSHLPVIMLTAKVQSEYRNQGYRAGADDYIAKPFAVGDLLVRIDSIIANRERIRRRFEAQTDFVVEEQHYSSPDKLFLESVIAKIRENLADSDYGREQLAADLCVSSSSLYNKLRAMTGKNITGFITSIRLKQACRILQAEPDIRISELAYRVGFATPRYFSQCFKKEFGMLVKDYVGKNIRPESGDDNDRIDRTDTDNNGKDTTNNDACT